MEKQSEGRKRTEEVLPCRPDLFSAETESEAGARLGEGVGHGGL